MASDKRSALDRAHEAIDRLCRFNLNHIEHRCPLCKEAHAALEHAVNTAFMRGVETGEIRTDAD